MSPEKFRLNRMKKGFSQKQFAEILKIDRSYMCQIEKGKKLPSLKLLNRMAEVLGISVKDFF